MIKPPWIWYNLTSHCYDHPTLPEIYAWCIYSSSLQITPNLSAIEQCICEKPTVIPFLFSSSIFCCMFCWHLIHSLLLLLLLLFFVDPVDFVLIVVSFLTFCYLVWSYWLLPLFGLFQLVLFLYISFVYGGSHEYCDALTSPGAAE